MASAERDSAHDWVLTEEARPPLLGELEARIDGAVSTARAAEATAVTAGAAALDAAQQARRAAGIAERAAATALDARRDVASGVSEEATLRVVGPPGDEALRNFAEHADRVSERLRDLSPANVAALR